MDAKPFAAPSRSAFTGAGTGEHHLSTLLRVAPAIPGTAADFQPDANNGSDGRRAPGADDDDAITHDGPRASAHDGPRSSHDAGPGSAAAMGSGAAVTGNDRERPKFSEARRLTTLGLRSVMSVLHIAEC